MNIGTRLAFSVTVLAALASPGTARAQTTPTEPATVPDAIVAVEITLVDDTGKAWTSPLTALGGGTAVFVAPGHQPIA